MEKVISTAFIALGVVLATSFICMTTIKVAHINQETVIKLEMTKHNNGLERDSLWLKGEVYKNPIDYDTNREEAMGYE